MPASSSSARVGNRRPSRHDRKVGGTRSARWPAAGAADGAKQAASGAPMACAYERTAPSSTTRLRLPKLWPIRFRSSMALVRYFSPMAGSQLPRDEVAHAFVGAADHARNAVVRESPPHRVLQHVAIATVQLHHVVEAFPQRLRGVHLGNGGLLHAELAAQVFAEVVVDH